MTELLTEILIQQFKVNFETWNYHKESKLNQSRGEKTTTGKCTKHLWVYFVFTFVGIGDLKQKGRLSLSAKYMSVLRDLKGDN